MSKYFNYFDSVKDKLDENVFVRYNKLKTFQNKNNDDFKKEFMTFYRMNRLSLSEEQIEKYFSLFSKMCTIHDYKENFKNIAIELHRIKSPKGKETLQFSFITKMLAFIDDSYPIYDTHVSDFFGICYPKRGSVDFRIEVFCDKMLWLKKEYEDIALNQDIKILLDETMKKYNLKISNARLIDFYVWTFGKNRSNECFESELL
jgi:hypothetical protein